MQKKTTIRYHFAPMDWKIYLSTEVLTLFLTLGMAGSLSQPWEHDHAHALCSAL